MIANVGAIRCLTAFAALMSICALLLPLHVTPYSWVPIRLCFGFSSAMVFMVAESWLAGSASPANKGRVFSVYMVINKGCFALGQLLLQLADPAGDRLFMLLSILFAACLVPIALARHEAPKNFGDERMSVRDLYRASPVGVFGAVEGYISAHNRYARDTYDILSFESLELLMSVIQNHCRSNPKDRLHGVLNGLLVSLMPDRLRAESPRVQITDGERQTALRRETIRRVQSRLQQRGLYGGAIDGRYTEATRSALNAFQSDLDFETTGFPDQTTLWRLLRN